MKAERGASPCADFRRDDAVGNLTFLLVLHHPLQCGGDGCAVRCKDALPFLKRKW